jgi:hypothetical protein
MMVKAPVTVAPQMAPTEKSVRGNAAQGDKPPPRVFERPSWRAPFAGGAWASRRNAATDMKPGKPLDEAARRN